MTSIEKNRYTLIIEAIFSNYCYSLQNHLRTAIAGVGQVETDEMYIGIDKRGAHYVLPVQAKGHSDRIGIVQIEQDIALCAARFPDLVCRPIAAQLIGHDAIALFELQPTQDGIRVAFEKHYRLVSPAAISSEDLSNYQRPD